ncbi:actin-related protein 2/3 complex subunit 5-C-like [Saccoglossus kowalevskii]|uniref:Actin-related protein 2/3 complex subunit 5 n=1 Tax=Saccoglossus kowalevskii TaxID=10224 RepID=A0ABM0GW45_SACKO|nr:PREDICTED: actin-related protein 2/3 complex subunit 5-like [Saccoglossus kowalevskii]
MAKNTGSSKFRKVDVDEYDENKYEDDQTGEVAGGPDEGEVMSYLNQGKNSDALHAVLRDAPIGSKNQAVKDKAMMLVLRVLTAFKTSEIEKSVKTLDNQTVDILMKYIYKGFELATDNSNAALLTWHEKAVAAGGLGSIVRVLTDRKSV